MWYLNKLFLFLRSNNSTERKICRINKPQSVSVPLDGKRSPTWEWSLWLRRNRSAEERGAMGTRSQGWGRDDVIRVGELGQWHRSPLPLTAPSRRPPVDINPCVRCIPDNASTLNWLGQCSLSFSLSISLFLCSFQLLCSIDLIQATFVLALSPFELRQLLISLSNSLMSSSPAVRNVFMYCIFPPKLNTFDSLNFLQRTVPVS